MVATGLVVLTCGSSFLTAGLVFLAGGLVFITTGWAFFAAVHALIESVREENKRYARQMTMLRARVLSYFAETDVGVELGVDTEATIAEKLHGMTDPVLGLALAEIATAKTTTGGEDERVELEAAALAGDALRQVLPPAGSEERRMLEMHFVEQRPLTEVAAAMGVDAHGYSSFVRRFHGVLASLRDGLAKRGIKERPPWREEVSGHVLAGDGE